MAGQASRSVPRRRSNSAKGANGRATASRGLIRRAIWVIARLRAGQKLTAGALAREFEVSIRTAYRDFDYLRDDMRVPAAYDTTRGTYALTEPTALVAPITLSRGEVAALFFAERVVRQYRGTPFERELSDAFGKIQELLPEEVSVSPELLDGCLSLDVGPVYSPDAEVFADLLAALRQRRVTVIRYRSLNSGRTTDRRIHPYHVFNHRGDWYLAAFDERRRAVRDFALHRCRRVTITATSFAVSADFKPRDYLAAAFAIEKGGRPLQVSIRFGARQARWIRERKWHASARVQGLIDGGCVLKFRATGWTRSRAG